MDIDDADGLPSIDELMEYRSFTPEFLHGSLTRLVGTALSKIFSDIARCPDKLSPVSEGAWYRYFFFTKVVYIIPPKDPSLSKSAASKALQVILEERIGEWSENELISLWNNRPLSL